MIEDTIVAISTALGVGAISIVRMSGKEALTIVKKIFKGKDLTSVPTHTIHHGFIVDKNEPIDEVLVSVMLAPKTYTGEDIVEINTHGGISATEKVLELCLTNGARLAEPGEFTKRAFLNGKMDLTKSEAIEDIINAKTDKSLKLSMHQLTGSLKNLIDKTRKTMVELMANIEVNIDYPEYEDAEDITLSLLKEKLYPITKELQDLLEESKNAKIIKDGLNVAIIGRPNVGKSSLLNRFLEEDKAIVTNIAGTTRDTVEGSMILSGIKINFIDTAGIRETDDIVEKIGVEKSKKAMEDADFVILLLNYNEEITLEDQALLHLVKNKKHILFINKNDLEKNIDTSSFDQEMIVYGNTTSVSGLEDLKKKIVALFHLDEIGTGDVTYLTNARHKALIKKAIEDIEVALNNIEKGIPVEMIEVDIRNAWNTLGEITGETYKDELIDELFSKFCLGK